MQHYILFFVVFVVAISTAMNVTVSNTTLLTMDNEIFVDNDESFYTVDVLLVAGGVFTPKVG
jgi:hypothetical protein